MENEQNESNKSKSYFDLYPNSFQKSKSFDKICGNIEQNDSSSK
jgi:hypothetical protein